MFGASLLIVLLFALVGVLVTGVVLMGLGGKANEKYSNKLMTARVVLQGLALVVLLLVVTVGK